MIHAAAESQTRRDSTHTAWEPVLQIYGHRRGPPATPSGAECFRFTVNGRDGYKTR